MRGQTSSGPCAALMTFVETFTSLAYALLMYFIFTLPILFSISLRISLSSSIFFTCPSSSS